VSGIQNYFSGFPVALSRHNPLPIFNGITRPEVLGYDNWRLPLKGNRFDPAVDLFLNRHVFPPQPNAFGNATRFNPKVRSFPRFNEDISVAKTFPLSRETLRIDFRWEAFNLLNRVVFGTGSTNLDSSAFGVVTNQVNNQRFIQLALKLYW
jgi:hypothetical protein